MASLAYNSLFWLVKVTTCMSGCGFFFRIDGLYHPDAYIVNGHPGTGQTGFEIIATFVFAWVYLAPIAGVIHAHFEGTASARRSAAVAPALYHIASTYGVLAVFGEYLNPYIAPVPAAAGMHAIYALLFVLLYIFARDDANQQQVKYH